MEYTSEGLLTQIGMDKEDSCEGEKCALRQQIRGQEVGETRWQSKIRNVVSWAKQAG